MGTIVEELKKRTGATSGSNIAEVIANMPAKDDDSGADSSLFIVNVEAVMDSNDTSIWTVMSADKTVAEIRAAVEAGKIPIAKLHMVDKWNDEDTCYGVLCSGLNTMAAFYAEFFSNINYTSTTSYNFSKYILILSTRTGNNLYHIVVSRS